jgi:cell wall-associated NlpC family hydrolase
MDARLFQISLVVALLAVAAPRLDAQTASPSQPPSPARSNSVASFSPTRVTDAAATTIPPGPSDADVADGTSAADFADPSEAVTARPVAAAAAAPLGEVGEKYGVSQREADSFLGRFASHVKHLVAQAMSYLGTPYRRGGSSRQGVDCSGLVGAVYSQEGLDLPRTAAEQFARGEKVAESDLRPGDLVFFHNTYKRGISHVGIFIGDGRFIHAAGHREGVIVSDLTRPYYRARFAGARRVAPAPDSRGKLAETDLAARPRIADPADGGAEPVEPSTAADALPAAGTSGPGR